jgi:hypothetical protein
MLNTWKVQDNHQWWKPDIIFISVWFKRTRITDQETNFVFFFNRLSCFEDCGNFTDYITLPPSPKMKRRWSKVEIVRVLNVIFLCVIYLTITCSLIMLRPLLQNIRFVHASIQQTESDVRLKPSVTLNILRIYTGTCLAVIYWTIIRNRLAM